MSQLHPIDGLEADVSFEGADPGNWRDMPDPDDEYENDEDVETPEYVSAILGFDPDDEEDSDGDDEE